MHDMEIVTAMRKLLAEKLGADRYELWLAPTVFSLANEKLTVEVASKFSGDWLRQHYRGTLEAVAESVVGKTVPVEFRTNTRLAVSPEKTSQSCNPTPPSQSYNSDHGTSQSQAKQPDHQLPTAAKSKLHQTATNGTSTGNAPASMAGLLSAAAEHRQEAVQSPRRRFATLESFVVGPCNRLAHASAQSATERLGSVTPLVVHGPHGCGKTHLLEAIWSAARANGRAVNAVYLAAEQFTTLFLSALRGSGLPSFRRKYRGVELLLIDDLQFFSRKKATLVELLHTIDSLSREGRQLVFSCDRPPHELSDLGPELTTRLSGGMVCKIEAPNAQTRLQLVHQFANRLNFVLPDDVAELIATEITAGARELSGAVNRLHAAGRLLGHTIDLNFAVETLAEMMQAGTKAVRLADIEHAVCDVFGLAKNSLQSGRRAKDVSTPRMLAMFLARKLTRAGLTEIGAHFGRRSHSTVISAHKRVTDWMANQSEIDLGPQRCKIDDALRRVEAQLRTG